MSSNFSEQNPQGIDLVLKVTKTNLISNSAPRIKVEVIEPLLTARLAIIHHFREIALTNHWRHSSQRSNHSTLPSPQHSHLSLKAHHVGTFSFACAWTLFWSLLTLKLALQLISKLTTFFHPLFYGHCVCLRSTHFLSFSTHKQIFVIP